MKTLSIIIVAKDAKDTIEKCLTSASFANEIIVVIDTRSKDQTEEMAKKFTSKIYKKEWQGYGETKNYAASKATGDMIFILDADEVISSKLQDEIKVILKKEGTADGFFVPEVTYFLDKPIKHCNWYPAYHIRFFKNGKGKYNNKSVHEELVLNGKVEKLENDIMHFSHPDYKTAILKLNEYSSLEVQNKIKSGKIKKIRFYQFLTKPFFNFGKNYIWHKGFLDGAAGLILCIHLAIYEFFILVKTNEYLNANKEDK